LELRATDGVHSTRADDVLDPVSRLDGLTPLIEHAAGFLAEARRAPDRQVMRPVFVIDAEADSVGHYRQWDAAGRLLLVRADGGRKVLHQGKERSLAEVARRLKRDGGLRAIPGRICFKGERLARQFVGETLVLHRPARTHRVVNRRTGRREHKNIPGPMLPMRLLVSELRDEHTSSAGTGKAGTDKAGTDKAGTGKVLARWLLLSNCPASVTARTLATWYYWRWSAESFHKLLKQAGQHVEQWQQETAAALARRLVVAAMAAVVVWQLARDASPAAADLRQLLVRLSGRQMKRSRGARGFTEPALTAGLGVLIPMLFVMQRYDVHEIRQIVQQTMPQLFSIDPDTS
jgi:hypothetical protein